MDQSIRQLLRQYASEQTDEHAHHFAQASLRAQGVPDNESVRYTFMNICSECDEPTRIFLFSDYLGYNGGLNTHLYASSEDALRDWQHFVELVSRDRQNITPYSGSYWTELPFNTLSEELEYLNTSIGLYRICYTPLN